MLKETTFCAERELTTFDDPSFLKRELEQQYLYLEDAVLQKVNVNN